MQSGEWEKWVNRHATAFGLTDAKWLSMFPEWKKSFAVAGYSAAELNEATDWMILHPPTYHTEHIGAIQRRIYNNRKERASHNDDQAQQQGGAQHGLCGDTGWVSVPHLKNVHDGEWFPPWGTFVVLCHCSRGERIRASHGEKVRAMLFRDYEARNPDWQRQMRQRREQQAAMTKAQQVTEMVARKGGIFKDPPKPDKRTAAQVLKDAKRRALVDCRTL